MLVFTILAAVFQRKLEIKFLLASIKNHVLIQKILKAFSCFQIAASDSEVVLNAACDPEFFSQSRHEIYSRETDQ
jgi:hypothetical protein